MKRDRVAVWTGRIAVLQEHASLPAGAAFEVEHHRVHASRVASYWLPGDRPLAQSRVDQRIADESVELDLRGIDLLPEGAPQSGRRNRFMGLRIDDRQTNFVFGDREAGHDLDGVTLIRGRLKCLAPTSAWLP